MKPWFSDAEVRGLDPRLVALLSYARQEAGVPFVITSGLRTHERCVELGAPNSAHQDKDGTGGKAVDLAAHDNVTRYHICRGLYAAGFRRIEVCPQHVHADIDATLVQDVLLLGPDK